MRRKSIQSTRGTVYYWTNEIAHDSEVALVFCHGLTADHTLFDQQVVQLSGKYKLITWDLPLHGLSRPYHNFSFQHVNEDLLHILKKENIDKVILIGQSAGGYIAQSFISTYRERVLGFIGIGTTPFGQSYYKNSELFWIRHFTKIAKLYPYRFYCKTVSKAVAITEAAEKNMYETLLKLGKKDMLKAASAVYGEFLKEKEELHMDFPVLITYGEHDQTGYVKRYARTWAEKNGYPLEIILNASHNANYDNWEMCNQLILSFVNDLEVFRNE